MSLIGVFSSTEDGFTGRIQTLLLDIEATLSPPKDAFHENAVMKRTKAHDLPLFFLVRTTPLGGPGTCLLAVSHIECQGRAAGMAGWARCQGSPRGALGPES